VHRRNRSPEIHFIESAIGIELHHKWLVVGILERIWAAGIRLLSDMIRKAIPVDVHGFSEISVMGRIEMLGILRTCGGNEIGEHSKNICDGKTSTSLKTRSPLDKPSVKRSTHLLHDAVRIPI